MTYEDPRKVLARHGMRPKRSFSQNFLCSQHAVTAIAAATEASDGDTVLELGPGCGALTRAILDTGASVVAIERDRDMRGILDIEFKSDALEVRAGDAAAVDFIAFKEEQGAPLRVAGNLPYAITGAIMRRLIDDVAALRSAVVMVQREVADRLVAPAGTSTYGALTVFSDNVFHVTRVMQVPKGAFFPPPKVDSTVIKLTPRDSPLTPSTSYFSRVVHATFQARRKTLRNALGAIEGVGAQNAEAMLAATGIDPKLRGERLCVQQFGQLATQLQQRVCLPQD